MKVDLSLVPKLNPSPIFKGILDSLKDPKNFKKTMGRLEAVIKTDHKHRTASSYVKCKECQDKYEKRKQMMRKLGFKNTAQYLEWQKVMNIIINKIYAKKV